MSNYLERISAMADPEYVNVQNPENARRVLAVATELAEEAIVERRDLVNKLRVQYQNSLNSADGIKQSRDSRLWRGRPPEGDEGDELMYVARARAFAWALADLLEPFGGTWTRCVVELDSRERELYASVSHLVAKAQVGGAGKYCPACGRDLHELMVHDCPIGTPGSLHITTFEYEQHHRAIDRIQRLNH